MYTGKWKNDAKIRLEYSDETLILRRNFFSKCSKKFSIGIMIMFKVCRRCLQRCSLRWKKNYERTIHTSKYIQKKLTPLTPLRGGQQFQRNFNSIWRDLSFIFHATSSVLDESKSLDCDYWISRFGRMVRHVCLQIMTLIHPKENLCILWHRK